MPEKLRSNAKGQPGSTVVSDSPVGLPPLGQQLVIETEDGHCTTLMRTIATFSTSAGFKHVTVFSDPRTPMLPEEGSQSLLTSNFTLGGTFQVKYFDEVINDTRVFTSKKIRKLTVRYGTDRHGC